MQYSFLSEMFGGFSSEEEDEGKRPPPPVPPASLPPDQTLSLVNPVAPNVLPAESPSPNCSAIIPPSSIPLETDPAIPETSPSDSTKARGGFRLGAGRSKTPLPAGCEVFLTESGTENFVCGCEKCFADKRSLLRHYQSCTNNQPTFRPPCKKRKFDSSVEFQAEVEVEHDHDTQEVHGETITTACFREDPDGAKLLQCKLILYFQFLANDALFPPPRAQNESSIQNALFSPLAISCKLPNWL